MGVNEMTRRSLVRAGAGALAGVALRPATTLASDRGQGRIATIALGSLRNTRAVALPAGVAVAGLQWRGRPAPGAELRVQLARGGWGPWGFRGRPTVMDPDSAAPGMQTGEPLWIGGARVVELRSAVPLEAGSPAARARRHRSRAQQEQPRCRSRNPGWRRARASRRSWRAPRLGEGGCPPSVTPDTTR